MFYIVLAYMYEHGINGVVEQDQKMSFNLLRQSAEQGQAKAQNRLGDHYCHGKGVEANYDNAVNWWRKSANQGEPYAQLALGTAYISGGGQLHQNIERGIELISTASSHSSEIAKHVTVKIGDIIFVASTELSKKILNTLVGKNKKLAEMVLDSYTDSVNNIISNDGGIGNYTNNKHDIVRLIISAKKMINDASDTAMYHLSNSLDTLKDTLINTKEPNRRLNKYIYTIRFIDHMGWEEIEEFETNAYSRGNADDNMSLFVDEKSLNECFEDAEIENVNCIVIDNICIVCNFNLPENNSKFCPNCGASI